MNRFYAMRILQMSSLDQVKCCEYFEEAENQEGEEYWERFDCSERLLEDVNMYIEATREKK